MGISRRCQVIPLYNFAKINARGGAGPPHKHWGFWTPAPLGGLPHLSPLLSKMVLGMHVLLAGFDAVVAMAERLPVTPLPEQNRVAAMRHDVIDIGRADVLPFLQALHTERVRFEVLLTGSPPCCTVTT